MQQMMLLNSPAATPSGLLPLRVVVLFLGIMLSHLWFGPALAGSNAYAQTAPETAVEHQVSTTTSSPTATAVSRALPPGVESDLQQGTALQDVCATVCSDGHLTATALCSLVLIAVSLISFRCLRTMVFLTGRSKMSTILAAIPGPAHSSSVSLLHLSISRI